MLEGLCMPLCIFVLIMLEGLCMPLCIFVLIMLEGLCMPLCIFVLITSCSTVDVILKLLSRKLSIVLLG